MGRRKLPVKLIEDKSSRQVTFSKRRKGLFKKANEISVLCDVDVAVIVVSGSCRVYNYCSSGSLPKMLQRYHMSSKQDSTVSRDGCEEENKYASFKTSSELLHIVERLDMPDSDQLSVTDLLQVEEQIADTLKHIRSRKTKLMMESVLALQEEETKLEEEKKGLKSELEAMKDGNLVGKTHPTQPRLLNLLG